MDLGDAVDQVMQKLRGVQHEFAAEENVLVLTLDLWVERFHDGIANPNRELKAQELFTELKGVAESNGYRWTISSPSAMGRQLTELKETLSGRLVIETRHTRTGNAYRVMPMEWKDEVQLF